MPQDQAVDVDFNTVTSVDWDDAAGATGYDVYFGDTCPPPTYPDAAFQTVSPSELTGLTLMDNTSYCWQVVSTDDDGCTAEGPVWTFQTACDDAVPGAPTVTSADAAYASGTTSDVYTLTFGEDVQDVATSVTWTPITGTGTLDMVTMVTASEYDIAFSGVTDGDAYTLTIGTGVTDLCGTPLDAAVDITIAIGATSCLDILNAGQSTGDGPYQIDPDGNGLIDVYCDMTGGGVTYEAIAVGNYDSVYADYELFTVADLNTAVIQDAFIYLYNQQGGLANLAIGFTSGNCCVSHGAGRLQLGTDSVRIATVATDAIECNPAGGYAETLYRVVTNPNSSPAYHSAPLPANWFADKAASTYSGCADSSNPGFFVKRYQ